MAATEDQYGFARRRIDEVKRITVTSVTTTEGAGIHGDVVHRVTRFYDEDGRLLGTSPEPA